MPDRNSKFQIDPKNANKYIFPLVSQDTLIVQKMPNKFLFVLYKTVMKKKALSHFSYKLSAKKPKLISLRAFPKAPSFVILEILEIAGSMPIQQKKVWQMD